MSFFDEDDVTPSGSTLKSLFGRDTDWTAFEADSAGEGHGPAIDWEAMADELSAAGFGPKQAPEEESLQEYTTRKMVEKVVAHNVALLITVVAWNRLSGRRKVKFREAIALRSALIAATEVVTRTYLRTERQFMKDSIEMEERLARA